MSEIIQPQGTPAQRRWARTQRDRLRRLGGSWLDADVIYQVDARGAPWWVGTGYYRLQDGHAVELLGVTWDEAQRAVSSLRRGELGPVRIPDSLGDFAVAAGEFGFGLLGRMIPIRDGRK